MSVAGETKGEIPMTTTETRRTCTDCGREHAWEARGPRGRGGMLIFACTACGAWGWAMRGKPGPVRAYRNAFTDPFLRGGAAPEPNDAVPVAGVQTPTLVAADPNAPGSIAVDSDYLYWGDGTNGFIVAMPRSGGPPPRSLR
jgi:hypothetical protein